ncbi:WD40-repeat-containing domain protein [Suillus fuscotomentosus]|uniref:WD40-repeat-containing domain protein n=1 Tax=Suillus fuscotomentosus TaxID=1912939 RepID=A0AAD4DU89_9AGAM|nr:WD40-repeat-containing domain protein [Suillus fuscotomentosus]KAG1893254.1 WD40-repeat-containing domain protein [Suillus fuscotomentosus]
MAVTTHKSPTEAPAHPVEPTLKGHEEVVYEVAFIRGTRLLVTGSADKSLRVWDLDTGKQVGKPLLGHDAGVWAVSASLDGRWIVSGGGNGSILVWEVATNKRELKRVPVSFKGHESLVQGIAFATDSETFASASLDETICVWKRETGKILLGPLQVGSWANSVSYSPNGAKLAAGTQKHIIIWNTETGEELLKIEQRAWRVAFTSDGLYLRVVSGHWNDIRILNATTGDIIKQFDVHIDNFFYSLAITPNGTKFATISLDNKTRFFDMDTFEPIGKPLEHPDTVSCVVFSEDSQLIATGCYDGHVRTWTVPLSESEKEFQQKPIPDPRPRPQRAPIPTSRFFDDFDPHFPIGRNNRAGTTRNAEGSKIKSMIDRIFSRSSAPQDQTPRPCGVPLVDVFATRGKYRTANAHSGKRDKLLQLQRPPRRQAHVGGSHSSTPPTASNVVNETAPATLQTGSANASATTNHPSPLDIEHAPDIGCFAVLARNAGPQIGAGTKPDLKDLVRIISALNFRPATNDRQVRLRDEDMETPTEERGSSGGCSLPTKVLVEVLDEHRDARGEEVDIIMKAFGSSDTIL